MHPTARRFFLSASSAPEPSFAARLEQWTKLGAAAIGFLYILGFLVHTLYLASYGVTVVSLLRAQYIMAGVWALAPIALIVGAVAWVLNQLNDEATMPKRSKASYALTVVSALFAFVFLVGFAVEPFGQFFSLPPNATTKELLTTAGILVFLILIVAAAVYGSRQATPMPASRMLWSVTLLAILLIAYVARFATLVYPGISASLGGGRPVNVSFSFGPNVQQVGSVAGDRKYPLLMATEYGFTVLVDKRATEVTRDAVTGVRYEP